MIIKNNTGYKLIEKQFSNIINAILIKISILSIMMYYKNVVKL